MRGLLTSLAFGIALSTAAQGQTLSLHVEESHAGAFYHLVETLPLNEPHTLVLLDAHSDANGMMQSDEVRAAIRRGPTPQKRAEMFEAWRKEGRIQCYHWMEPLMPAPVAQVIWIPEVSLREEDRRRMEAEAREFLDGHEEAFPRDAGPLAARFHVRSLEQFEAEVESGKLAGPMAGSVDLDFFAAMREEETPPTLERVMRVLLSQRDLRALNFAISSPYLKSAEQAEWLTSLALEACWRVPNGTVSFEPFAPSGPDRSLMARLLERQGKQLPRLDVAKAGPRLRSLLAHHWQPGRLRWGREQANDLLGRWADDPFLPGIHARGAVREPNGTWRFAAEQKVLLELMPEPVGARVRWYALRAGRTRYRIGEADFGFASNAPKWLWLEPVLLGAGLARGTLDLEALAPLLDARLGCGTVHLYAEVEREGEVWRTATETVRVRAAGTHGARAAWSEQFMLPYVFDARLLVRGDATGPETGWGADCATFVAAGLRAEGWLAPWGSPGDLRSVLMPVSAEDDLPKDQPVVVDFDTHAAALWEDKPPVGALNDEDLCVHHLEGLPEILPFGTLKQGRAAARTMIVRKPARQIQLLLAGDLMLGRAVGGLITQGEDPLEAIGERTRAADLTMGNLECVIAEKVAPRPGRHRFLAPVRALEVLKRAGFDAVSVLNNHARDGGDAGVVETRVHLAGGGLRAVAQDAVSFEVKGCRVTVLAWDDSLEPDFAPLVRAVKVAREEADYLIVLPHWGREQVREPTARQRALAAALLEAGADLVAGSGPHVVQPLEHYGLGSVAYSLGNFVFDGVGPDSAWQRGALLEVTLDGETKRPVRMRYLRSTFDVHGRVCLE